MVLYWLQAAAAAWAVLRPPVDATAAGTKGVAGETLNSADQAHRRPLNCEQQPCRPLPPKNSSSNIAYTEVTIVMK